MFIKFDNKYINTRIVDYIEPVEIKNEDCEKEKLFDRYVIYLVRKDGVVWKEVFNPESKSAYQRRCRQIELALGGSVT